MLSQSELITFRMNQLRAIRADFHQTRVSYDELSATMEALVYLRNQAWHSNAETPEYVALWNDKARCIGLSWKGHKPDRFYVSALELVGKPVTQPLKVRVATGGENTHLFDYKVSRGW